MKIYKDIRLYIVLVFIIKASLLAWSAHPFDFWTFVNSLERYTLYHWNPFEDWSKGNFLFVLWYPLYALYLTVFKILSLPLDNILLLHLALKIPFLFIDLFTGFLLYKIVLKLTNENERFALLAFVLYFINPIVFYAYGIHGTYSILIPFGFVLIIYGLIYELSLVSAIGLVIGLQTDYFFIVFVPFLVLYLLKQKQIAFLAKAILFSAIGLILSYIQFLFYPGLVGQTLSSLVFLSAANSPSGVTLINLPALNIFSAINYLFEPSNPITNISHPVLFSLFTKGGLYIIALCLVVQFLYRSYLTLYKKTSYSFKVLLIDLSIATFLFPIFLTNFQEHYLLWLVPAFILIAFVEIDYRIIYAFTAVTIIGFVYSFRGEVGTITYFLDIIKPTYIYALSSKLPIITYREGALIIAVIATSIWLFYSNLKIAYQRRLNANFVSGVMFHLCAIGILWVMILVPYVQVIGIYASQTTHFTDLAYERGILSRGSISDNYQLSSAFGNRLVFANSNTDNTLVMQELPRLSIEDQKNFQVFILFTGTTTDLAVRTLSSAFFNTCRLSDPIYGIENYTSGGSFEGIQIDTSCLKTENNSVILPAFESASTTTYPIELYISNKPVSYYFDPDLRIFIDIMAVVGLLYLALFAVSTYFIICGISSSSKELE